MTINSTTRKAGPFIGNGSTVAFPFAYKVFQAADLLVVRLDTTLNIEHELTLNTDYTVTLNLDQDSNPGGTVNLLAALATGYTLTLTSDLPNLQPTDLTNQGGFYPDVINDALDRATIQIQQLQEQTDRSLKVAVSSTADATLPPPAPNDLIGWDATGEALVNVDPNSLATVVAYATAYCDVFVGNGITTSWTLTRDPAVLYNLDVSINGSSQEPTRDYTLSGTTFTMTTPPPIGARVVVKYKEGLPNATADSQDVRFIAAGAGAVNRTVQSRLRETVSVLDYGFSASNTGAQNKAAFEAAIASADCVTIPEGEFFITGPIDVTGKVIIGAGKFKTLLRVPGVNTETTVFYNNKTSAASWGSGGQLTIQSLGIRGNWDGSSALADKTWDNSAALIKWASGTFVELTDVYLSYAYGHNCSFYRLGYSTFTRIENAAARKNGVHLEAPSGGDAITSTWIENSSIHSNRGNGNVYLKNGVGVFMRGITFEDSNCGVYLDGNDNRNVTVLTCHAESCPQGILNFQGAGTNTCLIDCFADAPITRSQPQFQTMIAYGNSGGALNAIEQEWTFGNPATNNNAGISVETASGIAYIRTRSSHPGYASKSSGYFEGRITTNQYGDAGPRMTARAYGNVNEDKSGWTWAVRNGAANAYVDAMHLTDQGFLFPAATDGQDLGTDSFYTGSGYVPLRWRNVFANQFRPGNGSVIWTSGAGSPEGVVTAPVGSLYTRTDGGAGTTLYVKQSGTGNTGWAAK